MTAVETTAFHQCDRFVLVRPRVCLACGTGFEWKLTGLASGLMMGIRTCAVVFGLSLFGLGILVGLVPEWHVKPMTLTEQLYVALPLIPMGIWLAYRSLQIGMPSPRLDCGSRFA